MKKQKIILWCNDNNLSIIDIIIHAGFKIACIINNEIVHKQIKTFTIDEFKKNNLKKFDHPIIIGNSKEQNWFLNTFKYIRNTLQIQNTIYHPLYLFTKINLDYEKRKLKRISYAGNGNTLIDNIVMILINHNKNRKYISKEFGLVEEYFIYLAIEYENTIIKNIENHFNKFDFHIESINNVEFGILSVTLKNKANKKIYIRNIESFSSIRYRFTGNSSYVKSKLFHIAHNINCSTIALCRNPLDSILSILLPHISSFHKGVTLNTIENELLLNLKNLRLVKDKFIKIKKALDSIIDNKDITHLIYFEKFRKEPIKSIKKLIEVLHLNTLSTKEVHKIWDSVNTKKFYTGSLSDLGYEPGKPRWHHYIKGEHLKIIKEIGLDKTMKKLGYKVPKNIDSSIQNYSIDKSFKSAQSQYFELKTKYFHAHYENIADEKIINKFKNKIKHLQIVNEVV